MVSECVLYTLCSVFTYPQAWHHRISYLTVPCIAVAQSELASGASSATCKRRRLGLKVLSTMHMLLFFLTS